MANPGVAMKLVHDDKIVFDLAATENVQVRIRDLMGRQVADNLIPVFNGHAQMRLEGFIGKPDIARANRKAQHLFVNGPGGPILCAFLCRKTSVPLFAAQQSTSCFCALFGCGSS
ncbi:MAG: hypothetical protein R3B71_00310 [Candidatus Gracilibacteria bacterium]